MSFNRISLAIAMACVSTLALANAPASASPQPLTHEEWLKRMTDFTQNGSAFRDPRQFVQWTNNITEPGFYAAMAQGVTDPAGWLNMANSAANPDAFRNWAKTADPQVPMRWAAAVADPRFSTAIITQMTDPGKMMRWVMAPMDTRWLNQATQFFNPNFYMKWGMSGMDPRTWNLMGNVINPALYTSVAGAALDPKSYGPVWGMLPSPLGDTTQPLPWSSNYGVNGAPFNGWFNWKPMPAYGVTDPWTEGAGGSVSFIPSLDTLGSFVGSLLPTGVTVVAPATPTKTASVAAVATVPAAPAVVKPAPAALEKASVAAAPVAQPTPLPSVQAAHQAAVPLPAKAEAAQPQPAVAAPAMTEGRLVLSGDALFKSGSADLKGADAVGLQQLAELADKIKATPGVAQIVVVGHADPTGNKKFNRKLSAARAKAIKDHLVAAGIKPAVIVTSGLGDKQPRVQCDAKLPKADKIACHAPNRRVEIDLRQAKPK